MDGVKAYVFEPPTEPRLSLDLSTRFNCPNEITCLPQAGMVATLTPVYQSITDEVILSDNRYNRRREPVVELRLRVACG